MTGARTPDPVAWVARAFPVDGPHDPDRMVGAGLVLAELCRYLAHATQARRTELPAPQLYSLLGALSVAARSLEQVIGQLAHRAQRLGSDPTVRVDELGAVCSPGELAGIAAAELDVAATRCAALARVLSGAQSHTARLYHADPDGGA